MMRIAVGGIMHESNSFSSKPTTLESFEEASLTEGDALVPEWKTAHHEMGGFLEGAEQFAYKILPTLMGWAMPSGMVTQNALDTLVGRMLERVDGGKGLDGMLLALHGAMVVEGYKDGDGKILRKLRDALGSEFPIVCTLDFHANVSQEMIDLADAFVIYKTNPHTDQRQRGLQAAEILTKMIKGQARPTMAWARPPMLFPILHQNTSREPLRPLLNDVLALEQKAEVLAASVSAGFPYADIAEVGPSAVVVTNDDLELAEQWAHEFSVRIWSMRDLVETKLPDATEAVRLALEAEEDPVVLVEMGDNVGGGSSADSTIILSELLKQNAERSVVVLFDPEAVQHCISKGIRREIDLEVGGKTDDLHGKPVRVKGRVRTIHDGLYQELEVRHGGRRFNDQGISAVLETENGSLIALTTYREPPFSLQQIISLGIDPTRMKILVVKAAIAYRAAYEPIAGMIIEVDTPGTTTPNPERLNFRNAPRPLWPLDQ